MTSCSKTLRRKRDRAILAILLGCELRCAEAVSIRMEHLASSLSPTSRVATKQRLLLRNPSLFSFSRVKVFVQPAAWKDPDDAIRELRQEGWEVAEGPGLIRSLFEELSELDRFGP
jgi:hypothetical protein